MTDTRRPWALDPGRTPVERILGKEFGTGGPLGLLGLAPDACTPESIADALARQLERVNEHPHATSHEADEVRMTLHAAAAQLLDPRTREAIIAGTAAGRSSGRPRRPLSPVVVARVRPEIRRTLGRFGGLNDRSMRFLALLADRHGIARDQLADAVRAAMRDPARPARAAPAAGRAVQQPTNAAPLPAERAARATPGRQAVARSSAEPSEVEIDPAVRMVRLVLVLGLVGVVCLSLAGGAVYLIVRAMNSTTARTPAPTPPEQSRAARPAPPAVSDRAAQPPPAPAAGAPRPAGARADPVDSARALSAAVEKLGSDAPAAIDAFGRSFAELSASWIELPADRVTAAQDSIVEFMYRAPEPSAALEACRVIASLSAALREATPPSAERVVPGVWAVGTLARLARERELPAQARATIDAELAVAASGVVAGGTASYWAGASAAVLDTARRLVRAKTAAGPAAIAEPGAYEQWMRAAKAVAGADDRAYHRFVLAALEALVTDGPEPEPSSPAAGAVRTLVGALNWRADGEARARLIRWFDSPQVSSVDLNAITGALAGASGAEGVDASMVLAWRAGLPERQEVRDRYLAAWSMTDQRSVDELVKKWSAEAARLTGDEAPAPDASPASQLARAAILARLNLAATQLYANLTTEPGETLRTLDAPVLAAMSAAGATAAPATLVVPGDGAWAIRYLSAEKNIPQRAALLADLGQHAAALGPVDAETLAAEAFRGAPAQIRRSAAEVLAKLASSPAVVNAALEQAPFLPRSQESTDLVRRISLGRVPQPRDADWRVGVRRALVERLLQMLASRTEDVSIDALASVLGEAYSGRASVASVDHAAPGPAERLAPDAAARAVRIAWQRWAEALPPSGREPMTIDQVLRRYAGRSTLAEGLVQSFAAEQGTAAELMAFVVVAERPDAAPQARAIIDRMNASRRRAEHIFAQILVVERAMTELWMLRMDSGRAA